MPSLVACPECENHVQLSEAACPHCGASLRDRDGRLRRTATAALLGLAAVASACGRPEPVAEYGPPPMPAATEEPVQDPADPAATDPDAPPDDPGGEPVAEYGPPPTSDDGYGSDDVEPMSEYGPAPME